MSRLRRWVLIGDAQSPHLLKWARALQASGRVELWVASSRGFDAGFDGLLPDARRLALGHRPRAAGGNVGVLRHAPALGRWLATVDADVLHAHYLTSHGTLAWIARRTHRLRAALVASAWGSDILVAPRTSAAVRWLTRRVLADAVLATSDSAHMAEAMRVLGAGEVMTFPFGLEALPAPADPAAREPWLFYANRGLEPIYRPGRVLDLFAAVAAHRPEARLVVAHDGSLRDALLARVAADARLASRVLFMGRLDAAAQAAWYSRARWYLSLPSSDSVAVSVLEALAHGAVPVLSDLPANRELVRDGDNGLIVGEHADALSAVPERLDGFAPQADIAAAANRDWIAAHGVFAPAVQRFLDRCDAVLPPPRHPARR